MGSAAQARISRPARVRGRRSAQRADRRLAALLVTPSLLAIGIVAAYPIGYAIWLSVHEYSVRVPGLSRFAGLRNYTTALGDDAFWSALWTTLLFTAISVGLELVIGMVMALVMNEAFRGRTTLRAVVLIPWGILTVVTAIIWRSIFEPQLGVVNSVLSGLDLPGANTVWLGEQGYAFAVIVLADVWKTAPFMALLLLAGLQIIPQELYDAAKVDGASTWQRFRRITLPLLRPAIYVALIFRTLDALRIFDLPYVLTHGANGTETLSLYAYQKLTVDGLVGLGSALSVITFAVVIGVSLLYLRAVGGSLRKMTEQGA
jgi:multiple sugar transport system permease protein